MAGDEDKSLEAGMNGHVTKPIYPDQLFATLQKWMKPSKKRLHVQQTQVPSEQAAPDKASQTEDELPESLSGFDLADGLKRLQGNKKLYRKLLLGLLKITTRWQMKFVRLLMARILIKLTALVHPLQMIWINANYRDF